MDLEERKNELNKKIDLSCGFEELRRNLEVSEDMEEWKAMGEIERRGKVENQLPTIQEENGNDLGAEFSEIGGKRRESES